MTDYYLIYGYLKKIQVFKMKFEAVVCKGNKPFWSEKKIFFEGFAGCYGNSAACVVH